MDRIEIDIVSGEVRVYSLTEQEIANIQNTPKPVIIREIDDRRLRLALHQLGLLDTVEAAIATLDRAAQIDWDRAIIIKEDYPLVAALANNLGLDTDAIFTLAISLS